MKYIKLLAAGMLACGLVAIAVGGSFFVSGTKGTRPVKTPEDYMRDAELYLNDGDYDKAVVSYEKLLDEEQYGQEALSGMADACSRMGNYEEEENIRNQIAQEYPDNLDNQIRLIEIMIQKKELETAKAKTEELLKETGSDELKSLYKEMDIATPEFNLTSGSYDAYQLLKLANTYDNAVVHYTIDGNEPTEGSPIYKDGIVISYPETVVRAIAVGALGYRSGEATLNMTITKPVEEVQADWNNTALSRIKSNILNKSWDSPVYNYELAQLRELYLLGEYYLDTEIQNAVFYGDCYKRYESREYGRGGFDIEFARYTPFLRTLFVGYQKDLDLAPLAGLQYLEDLSLLNNNIMDISPLAGLTSLKRLALGWNSIGDASPLAGLVNLESLGLWDNQIRDVSMLGGLTELTYFDISGNQVTEIECVRNMPKLNEVWINNNQIETLAPLDACDQLMVLMQGSNPISDYGTVKEKADNLYKSDLEL